MVFIKEGILECELMGVTPQLKHVLRSKLRYENQQHIIARAIAKKRYGKIPKALRWDGVSYLIDEKNRFPSGLLALVLKTFKAHGQAFQFLDKCSVPEAHPVALTEKLELWKHQRDAVEAIKITRTGIVQIGTGGGKTKASIVACSEIGQFPFLFVVNRISLLNQTHAEFVKYFGAEKVGYLGNGQVNVNAINIASIGTLCSMLKIKIKNDEDDNENFNYSLEQIQSVKNLMAKCRFVIADEAHHGSASTYKVLLKALPQAFYRIGLTATPFRTNESENILLEAAFGEVIYKKTASELIADNILVKPKIFMVKYLDSKLGRKYPKDDKTKIAFTKIYKECVVENSTFNKVVSECAIANADYNRLTLVSVKQINHGKNIYDFIKKLRPGMPIEFLNGENKKDLDEDIVKQNFADGKIKILISTLFDEGVDIPKIDTVIDASGGKSAIKALQLTGRAMRKYPGKTEAFIFMFVQQYTYLYNHSKERAAILKTEPEFDIELIKWQERETV